MGAWLRMAEAWLAIALLAAIVVLVLAAGLLRWFGAPLVWSVDLAQLLFIWVSFLGADLALGKRAHIGIDLLVRRLPGRARVVLDLALALLAVAFLGAMVVMGYRLTMLNLERQFGDSGISYGFVTIAVPAGCALLTLTLLGEMLTAVRSLAGRPQPIFSAAGKGTPGEEEEIVP